MRINLDPKVLLIISALCTIAGDFFAKTWGKNPDTILYFFSAMLIFLIGITFYMNALVKGGLIVSSFYWSVIGDVGIILLGWLVFKEQLGVKEIIGVVCAVAATILLT